MTSIIYALLSTFAVSLVSLIGVASLSANDGFIRRHVFLFVSLAVGALLGDAFIHLIPEALETHAHAGMLVVIGIACFFLIERFLHWHHHGDDIQDKHVHPVGKLVLFSDALHNFIDGIIIGLSFMVNIPLGIATTIAVVLHEIPQEIGDFAVLLHAGYSRKRALWLNFLSGLAAVIGTVVAFAIGGLGETVTAWVLPIAAGGFIYIAIADLMPELQKTKSVKYIAMQLAALILGVAAMFALTFLE